MIEKYFITGYHYEWNKPVNDDKVPRDGALSRQIPTPCRMTYKAIDGNLYNLAAPHISTLGFGNDKSFRFNWLNYTVGRTASISLYGDTLTGFMSGCVLATWTEEGGPKQVGHVGTVESSVDVSNLVKKTFRDWMPENTQGFSPLDSWSLGEIAAMQTKLKDPTAMGKILGLITATGEFYSVLVFTIGYNSPKIIVGGIKRADPIPYAALRVKLGAPMIGRNRV